MHKKSKKNSLKLNILENRKLYPYKKTEYFGRILWSFFLLFFRYSPRVFFEWRNFILRIFGAKIGKNVHIYPSAIIYLPWNLKIGDESSIGEWTLIYNLGKVDIGSRSTISHRAHLCAGTHQYSRSNLPLMRLPIKIGDEAWICSDSFIGPNVNIGKGAIVGAAAVIMKSVKPMQIVAGNPAKFVKMRKIKNKK
jgi:putative colanic acid biosynthesis acetyltransferase WcaF